MTCLGSCTGKLEIEPYWYHKHGLLLVSSSCLPTNLLPKAMELTRVAIRQKFPNRSLDPVDVSASHVIRPAGKQLRTLRAVHDCLRGKICNGPIYLVAAAVIPLFAGTALPVSTAAKEINPEIAVLN
ncbi:hypothetical protein MCOR02_006975 [Pyricularia oryzae]|nr:hypothetical protein MCOR02_006975 [Pyricularia oryzae]